MKAQGRRFVRELSGDGGYARPDVNFIALENLIVGWVYGQTWFDEFRRDRVKQHPREDVFCIVRDWALQAAMDVTERNPLFRA